MQKAYLFFILTFLSFSLPAQDIIRTMSGFDIECQVIDDQTIMVKYRITKKNGKVKDLEMNESEIFSISKGGTERIIYEKDPLLGNEFSEEEMKIYIAGERDARMYYDSRPTMYAGLALGGAAAYLAAGAFLGTFAVPMVYPLVQLIPIIKIKESSISDPKHQYNEIYALGYERVARSKKLLNAIKGAAAGAVAGYLIWRITDGE